MKLCLGTAQFGLDYGINNQKGKIPTNNIPKILSIAHDNGITILDSASAYGESETVLGKSIYQTGKYFRIITKYPSNTDIPPLHHIESSLSLLKRKSIYGYLFHNYSIFEKKPRYIDDFVKLKQIGKCEKIGFSLYFPSEAEYIIKNDIPCDIVQIPFNIFDQRFMYLFPDLINRGIEIYIRSVFLQGLFFINPDKLGFHFDSIKSISRQLHQLARDQSISIAAICLYFIEKSIKDAYVIFGIDSMDNLKENINNFNSLQNIDIPYHFFQEYSIENENIILPFNWKV